MNYLLMVPLLKIRQALFDIDGYFVANPRTLPDIVRELNKLDPYKVWTWDWSNRIYDRNSAKPQ